uniref:Uncharacterized protein n=1 Tax=Panagrolaimus sp. ES5 TaxID=591445 RepID=A0AC34GVL1_9BILA
MVTFNGYGRVFNGGPVLDYRVSPDQVPCPTLLILQNQRFLRKVLQCYIISLKTFKAKWGGMQYPADSISSLVPNLSDTKSLS